MQSYHHFTNSERKSLEEGRRSGKSLRSIAKELGKDVSSVSRELKRNSQQNGQYSHHCAFVRYMKRRRRCSKPYRLETDETLYAFVIEKLKRAWSPETITAIWKRNHPTAALSHTTIYRALCQGRLQGCSRKSDLRRRGKRKYHRGNESRFNSIHPDHTIHQRSPSIEERLRIGDWEGDTIVGMRHHGCIVTLVDRKSRYLVAVLAQSHSAQHVKDALLTGLLDKPVFSITLDNGSEFAAFRDIERALNTTVYFADPHAPWQRGSNENTNGILRFFFPKGSDFDALSQLDLQAVSDLINHRPRKCLDWLSPYEAFFSPCCT